MSTLREAVQKSIQRVSNYACFDELQQLLNEHQDDAAFEKAVAEKWSDEDEPCHALVLSCREEVTRLGDEEYKPTGKDRVNVPASKT